MSLELQLLTAIVAIVFVYFVVPEYVFPAMGRWYERRRGRPADSPGPWSIALMAAAVAAFVIAISWSSEEDRPLLAPMVLVTVGVLLYAWRRWRR